MADSEEVEKVLQSLDIDSGYGAGDPDKDKVEELLRQLEQEKAIEDGSEEPVVDQMEVDDTPKPKPPSRFTAKKSNGAVSVGDKPAAPAKKSPVRDDIPKPWKKKGAFKRKPAEETEDYFAVKESPFLVETPHNEPSTLPTSPTENNNASPLTSKTPLSPGYIIPPSVELSNGVHTHLHSSDSPLPTHSPIRPPSPQQEDLATPPILTKSPSTSNSQIPSSPAPTSTTNLNSASPQVSIPTPQAVPSSPQAPSTPQAAPSTPQTISSASQPFSSTPQPAPSTPQPAPSIPQHAPSTPQPAPSTFQAASPTPQPTSVPSSVTSTPPIQRNPSTSSPKIESQPRTNSTHSSPQQKSAEDMLLDDSIKAEERVFSKRDFEELRAQILKQVAEETAILAQESQEIKQKYDEEVRGKAKLKSVLMEYEKTIAKLIDEAGNAAHHEGLAERVTVLEAENKRKTEEYESIALAHSELKSRYEAAKTDNEKLKSNEQVQKETISKLQNELEGSETRFNALKTHAETKLDTASEQLVKMRDERAQAIAVLQARLQKTEARVAGLEKENKEYLDICNDLMRQIEQKNA